ncbi:hypothetical protein [Granulicella sp. L60]|jgi:hypothetical protein|uniref:hypothetical protein n=1 Tax=Granulicella sp. L60 TaxID=1641866 RepID=UPI00131DB9BF|nr:hypothetical protein [Granulicella sp. L60]
MNPAPGSIDQHQAQLTVHLAEYSALRSEITNFQSIEHQSLSFAIAAITGLIALIVTAQLGKDPIAIHAYMERPEILLAGPPFLLLGFLFAYAQIRIIQVASYLHQDLCPKIAKLSGGQTMGWESHRRKKMWRGAHLCAELFSGSRWLLFVWPIVPLFRDAAWKQTLYPTTQWILPAEQAAFVALCVLGFYCWLWLPRRVVS